MDAVYIYDALRTPRGKARPDGGLAALSPQELVRLQIDALSSRTDNAAREAESLLLGCVTQSGAQGGHIALVSKLHAGLPDAMAAITLNNYCTSGLSAIGLAAAMVGSGQVRSALAGGVEMMSHVPFMADRASYYGDTVLPPRARYIPPVVAADRLAAMEGIGRAALDEGALLSQDRAAASEGNAALNASRIPTNGLAAEECPRGTTAEKLAALPAAFGAMQADFAAALEGETFPALHSLAHAPPMCDGAAMALIGGAAIPAQPRARVLAFAERGGDPAASLTAGFSAMDAALASAGLALSDMDRIEFMEAFAVTIAKFMRDRAPDMARVNVGGGHLAKGHPMGASGAILLSTLLDALDAADGRYGLVVTTGAGGAGTAMVVERMG